jgi:hypothetical protein
MTFDPSRKFDITDIYTAVGYHPGESMPIITMTLSPDVTNVNLFLFELDATWEELDPMSPVPVVLTGNLCLCGNTVHSSVNDGAE